MEHPIQKRLVLCALALILVLTLAVPGMARAQSGGGYDQTWNTVDGGGYMFSTGGGYRLGATIGQPDAGALSGAGYSLVGGFWAGAMARYPIYLPLVLRS
jgi:hypothetical protein